MFKTKLQLKEIFTDDQIFLAKIKGEEYSRH